MMWLVDTLKSSLNVVQKSHLNIGSPLPRLGYRLCIELRNFSVSIFFRKTSLTGVQNTPTKNLLKPRFAACGRSLRQSPSSQTLSFQKTRVWSRQPEAYEMAGAGGGGVNETNSGTLRAKERLAKVVYQSGDFFYLRTFNRTLLKLSRILSSVE